MKKILTLLLLTCFIPSLAIAADSTGIEGLTLRESRKIARASKKKTPAAKATKLADVCKKVTNISGLLVKTTAGGHIPRSDPRYSGFSIVCAGRCVPFPAKVYHCDGTEAFKMGYYGRWVGNGKSRGYCGTRAPKCPTTQVRAKSKSLKCSGAGYLATGGGSCMRLNLNINRNGGV